MTDPHDETARAEAIRLVCDIFDVDAEHITKAPRYCGDGEDGSCWRGGCHIVAAVDIIAAALRARPSPDAALVEALRKLLGELSSVQVEAVREGCGNTNAAVLQLRIDEARVVVAAYERLRNTITDTRVILARPVPDPEGDAG